MRVNAIQSSRVAYSAPKFKAMQQVTRRTDLPLAATLSHDSVILKNNTIKGAGLGAILGFGIMALLSFMSGGIAGPAAYALYTAAFGAAGGLAGNALDNDKSIGRIS